LEDILQQEFGDQVQVVAQRDPRVSGRFEVTIMNNGKLIHSRATRRQGLCDTPAEQKAVVAEIRAFLESQK
jgi:hypothetical protein